MQPPTSLFNLALLSLFASSLAAPNPNPAPAVVDPVMSASMAIPYTLQAGPTRYAPMQTQPGKSITATETRRQYPTSAYTIFTTKGPAPNIQTTVTQGWDYTLSSKINTVCFCLDTDRLRCWILLTFFRGALRRRHSQCQRRICKSFCRGGEIKGVLVVVW